MRVLRAAVAVTAALLAFVPGSSAQEPISEIAPAHLALVEGSTTLTRDGERDVAESGTPIVQGDVIRADRGRANILFPDGSALDLDEFSTVELLSPTLVRLSEGRLILTVVGAANPAAAAQFVVDTPVASAETQGPGEYRISLLLSPTGMQTELAVVRGAAALVNERGNMPLRPAQRSVASDGAAPTYPQPFNSARLDAFVQWSASLRDQRAGSASSRYLPAELRTYGGSLDRNGAWQYENDYGNVWYPNVAADWRPYDDGYWSSVPAYGWTWIGVNVWSWPTHHYGRWGYRGSRWFWIPDRRWAPAWVSWGAAPGYVSWCPLGFDNRPVFSWGVSYGNRWGGSGWTILARDRFGERGRNIRHDVISPGRLPGNVPFVTQTSAPPVPARAVRRGGAGTYQGGRTSASSTSGLSQGSPGLSDRAGGGRERWRPAPPASTPAPGAPDRSSPRAVPRGGGSTPSRPDVYARPEPLPQGQTPPQAGPPDGSSGGRAPSRSRNPMIYSAPARPSTDEPVVSSPDGRSRAGTIYSTPAPAPARSRNPVYLAPPRDSQGDSSVSSPDGRRRAGAIDAAPAPQPAQEATPSQRRGARQIERAPAPAAAPVEAERPRREAAGRRAEAPASQPAPRASEPGNDRPSGGRAAPRGRDTGQSAPAAESGASRGGEGGRAQRRAR